MNDEEVEEVVELSSAMGLPKKKPRKKQGDQMALIERDPLGIIGDLRF